MWPEGMLPYACEQTRVKQCKWTRMGNEQVCAPEKTRVVAVKIPGLGQDTWFGPCRNLACLQWSIKSGSALLPTRQPAQLLSACCRVRHVPAQGTALVPAHGTHIPSTLTTAQARSLSIIMHASISTSQEHCESHLLGGCL